MCSIVTRTLTLGEERESYPVLLPQRTVVLETKLAPLAGHWTLAKMINLGPCS